MQAMATIIDDNFWKTKEDDKENDKESEKINSNAFITNDDLTFKEHISRQNHYHQHTQLKYLKKMLKTN